MLSKLKHIHSAAIFLTLVNRLSYAYTYTCTYKCTQIYGFFCLFAHARVRVCMCVCLGSVGNKNKSDGM